MHNKYKKRKYNVIKKDGPQSYKKYKEIIEDFLYSDTVPATATKFLLAFIALGAVPFIGALSPGIFSAVRKVKRSGLFSEKQISAAIHTLKSRKLVEILQENENSFKVRLTNKGKERIKNFCFDALEIETPGKWDGKWRILMFDIPTKPKIYNQAREAFRQKIKELGFYQMQKSAWVYPYECEDELLFIAEIFKVKKYIEILTVEKLLHQIDLKNKFGLS
jgi:hypothetical protein